MSAADLLEYVGAGSSDLTFVTACWDSASALVTDYIGETTVPAEIVALATKEVGAELFHRRSAKNGVMQFAAPDAAPARIARDPMVAAYPLLDRYVTRGLA